MDIETGELLLPCGDLPATQAFFCEDLGFRLVAIRPADDPREALLEGHGLRLRLVRGLDGAPGALRLRCRGLAGATELHAPNGTRVELVPARAGQGGLALPPATQAKLVLARASEAAWGEGRAAMRYRDLIPGRSGGRFVASHICIPAGGAVADYVHYHAVRLQLIYCYRGWVRVVYEDQGPPFVLEAGDCVLQAPQIRHQVLESSAGLEVIELGCPAEHETLVDHELSLPTGRVDPQRRFGGQRFVRHQLREASWRPYPSERSVGFEARDTGIAAASEGLARVEVLRPLARGSGAAGPRIQLRHEGELRLLFVLEGAATFARPGHADARLAAADALTLPAGLDAELREPTPDCELLEIAVEGLRD